MAAYAVLGIYAIVIFIIYRAIQWVHYGIQKHEHESENR